MASSPSRFTTVKRKLETMKYPEPLDKLSVPLAEHLVDDLVHTTESYRNLKLQHNRTVQEYGDTASQLDALTKEHERVVLENNMLHLETIKASESKDDSERRVYQRLKSQEEKIAEFAFWKEQSAAKLAKVEKENLVLRRELEEARPGFVPAGLSKKLRDSRDDGLEPAAAPSGDDEQLKMELEAALSANRELALQVQDYKTKVENRDLEIRRLGSAAPNAKKGKASLDQIIAEEREEENQSRIKGLTRQTEYLTEKLSSYEDLHAAYKSLEEEKFQLVAKLEDVLGENKDLAAKVLVAESKTRAEVESEEVASLKFTLSKYEEEMVDLSKSLQRQREVGKTTKAKLEIAEQAQKRAEAGYQEKAALYESARWRVSQLETENGDLEQKAERREAELERLQGDLKDLPVKDANIEHLERANRNLTERLAESEGEVRRHLESLKATNEVLSKRSEESNAFVGVKIELESKVTELEKRCQLAAEGERKKDEELRALREKTRLRSSDNARMEVVVKNLQSELDSTKTMNQILNDKVSLLSDEKKAQEPLIAKLRMEYNDLQESSAARVAQMHKQTMELTKQNMELSEGLETAKKSLESLTKENNELSMEFSHKKSEKSDADREISSLSSQVKMITVQKDRAEQSLSTLSNDLQMRDIEVKALQQEVSHFKDQSAEMRRVLQAKSTDLAKAEEEKTSLEDRIRAQAEVVEKQKQELSEAQTRAVSNISQEEDIKTQVAMEQANALKYKSLYDKARSELNMLKDQISNVSNIEESFQEELYFAKAQADERLFEINQLKSLINQLDLTQNKLVAKLKVTIAELEETKRAKREVEDLCTEQGEAKSEIGVEVDRLKSAIRELDGEKDKIQDELDTKCEAAKRLEDTVEAQSMELHSAKLELSNSQIKIREMEESFKSFKGEYDSILSQCKRLHSDNTHLQEEVKTSQSEINALSEDMTQMAREQQVVNADLVRAVAERSTLQDEVEVLLRKSSDQEKIIQMKVRENKEYTEAYKELGADNQSVLARISDLEREIMEKNALIVAKDSEISTMENILSDLEIKNRQAVSDLTSYEAATSELTSALSSAENRMDRDSRDKLTLVEKARLSKENAMQLEAARNQMQNEVYKAQVARDNMEKSLRDVRDENAYLREELAVQAEKEKNLEGIIGDMRSREYKDLETETSLPAHEEEIRSLREDNERLLQLLSTQEERKVMDEANEEELRNLRSQNEHLLQLLSSQEEKGSASSSPEAGPRGATPAKTPRTKLNEQLSALRDENKRLRSNLQATQETVGRMSSEINRVRDDYQAVVKDLSEV